MTKSELEQKLKEVTEQLETERNRPTGHKLEQCSIDMSSPDETKIAIANAVNEGMKALQGLGGNSYGIYFEGPQS